MYVCGPFLPSLIRIQGPHWIRIHSPAYQYALSLNVSFKPYAYLLLKNLWTLLSRVVKKPSSHLWNVARGSHSDHVYLGWPVSPSYMSPNAGGWGERGLRGLSLWVQLYTRSPNKLWRSYSIFNLWMLLSRRNHSRGQNTVDSQLLKFYNFFFIAFFFFFPFRTWSWLRRWPRRRMTATNYKYDVP